MSEHGQTAQDTNSPNHGNDNRGKAFRRVVFIGVLLVVVVVFAALILVAVYHPYLNERVKFVSTFRASTVAPGTIAPCSSVIIPWIVPDVMS